MFVLIQFDVAGVSVAASHLVAFFRDHDFVDQARTLTILGWRPRSSNTGQPALKRL